MSQIRIRLTKPLALAIFTGLNVVLLIINTVWLTSNNKSQPATDPNRYPLLSKRIFAENPNDVLINFVPLRNALEQYVAAQPTPLGVYFEYLPSGSSIGANSQMEVKLASLIKVPAVMATYKEVEKGRLSLDKMVTLKEDYLDPKYGSLWQKGAGAQISIRDAIRLTLIESDNTALRVLDTQLPPEAIGDIFNDLNIPPPTKDGPQVVTPKNYSSILRSLYLSASLTREHSNEILDLLTQTKFQDKLPAALPNTLKIAHKIGVWEVEGSQTVYNDCGIVYVPNRPFMLCMMTQTNEASARAQMQHVAKTAYDYIINAGR
jgi:beta-lactamase class A